MCKCVSWTYWCMWMCVFFHLTCSSRVFGPAANVFSLHFFSSHFSLFHFLFPLLSSTFFYVRGTSVCLYIPHHFNMQARCSRRQKTRRLRNLTMPVVSNVLKCDRFSKAREMKNFFLLLRFFFRKAFWNETLPKVFSPFHVFLSGLPTFLDYQLWSRIFSYSKGGKIWNILKFFNHPQWPSRI